jgi:pyruvate/2-oxoglutarate/acetoin dehydrogenase E1 component
MKIYIHEGNGHYIGSCVIVIAGSKLVAETMIRKELDDAGLPREQVDIKTIMNIDKRKVVKVINGDY